METVSGWLFLNLERTRLVFVADALEVVETFDWNLLLHGDCLERFLQHCNATPTSEGALEGFRIDASAVVVKQWLHECVENADAHAQRTRSLKLPQRLVRQSDEAQSEGSPA